ncbi:apolipoprotein L3-like [Peromyscus leucopus]|uniref:apolipoprotein L3-like n=1 Tax=Peromyscus leucopus TaxID=10041 RepID=UPI001884B6C9|nr:apolipoprotein L3-like [Peromyscus leucopus]
MGSPERRGFIESVVEYLWDTRSKEDLKLQLNEVVERQQLVEGTALSSFNLMNLMLAAGLLCIAYITFRKWKTSLREAPGEMVADPDGKDVNEEELQNDLKDKTRRKMKDNWCEALGKNIVATDVGDDNKVKNDIQEKKRFLEDYAQVKLELEQQIEKLRALADKIDKVHRDCTITQVVAKSTGAVSGVLTILGLALAPVTAGVSLGLSATGLGLGAAAAVTSVSTSLVEKVITAKEEAKASQLVPTSKDQEELIKEVLEESKPVLVSVYKNSFQKLEDIKKNIDAIKLAKANSHLKTNAKRLMTTGRVSAQNTKKVKKAFGGTALAMSKGARIMGAATTGLSILMDVVSLVEDTKHLQEGAKTESAAELRQKAQNLEQKLQELIRVHDSLTK